jgi:hypothetical protein
MACNKESAPDFLSSFGKVVTIEKKLQTFNRVFIQDEFDVELIQDSQNRIEISYGENVVDKISAEVMEGELILKNENRFNWVRKLGKRIQVRLHCGKMDVLKLDGDGTIFNRDTFYGDTLDFIHSGTNSINLILKSEWATFRCSNSGGLTLKGSCGILSGTIEETAVFDGKDFLASDAYLFQFSLANSFVRAEQLYGLKVFGKGNIFYMQDPIRKFDKTETGAGRVLKFF